MNRLVTSLKLPQRFMLTATLTPVFWFAYLWSLYLSPQATQLPLRTVVPLLLGISLLSAYCVTLFILILKRCDRASEEAREATSIHQGDHAQAD